MKRRNFLLGGGSLFLAGCAGGAQRPWAEVPWVGEVPPVGPAPACPTPAYTTTPSLEAALRACACPPAPASTTARPLARSACVAPPPRPPKAPRASGAGWKLVAREQWGAACLRANHDPMGAISRITLHHTDEHAGMRGRPDAEVVRAIQAYHQDHLGWADIGYHFLVGADGRVYEGRALSAQGAHAGGANNRNNLGISVIGNFSDHLPSARQLQALTGFLGDRQAAYGVTSAGLLGHRDLSATECPGSALYAWLQDFKRA